MTKRHETYLLLSNVLVKKLTLRDRMTATTTQQLDTDTVKHELAANSLSKYLLLRLRRRKHRNRQL